MNQNRKPRWERGGCGGAISCLCVTNITPEEVERLMAQLTAESAGAKPDQDGEPEKPEFGSDPEKGFEGDGEEIFGEMMDDLLHMAALVDTLYGTIYYLADRRMTGNRAMERGRKLLSEADRVLEKWQRYSMPEA